MLCSAYFFCVCACFGFVEYILNLVLCNFVYTFLPYLSLSESHFMHLYMGFLFYSRGYMASNSFSNTELEINWKSWP